MTIKELSQLYHLNREIEMDQQRLADLDDEIRRDEDRLARLEMKATSVSGPNYDGMPKAPSYEAASIWASNGKDEDYTFGYTEEELEDALR